MIKWTFSFVILLFLLNISHAQDLPKNWHLDRENHRLKINVENEEGFYNFNEIESIHLDFYPENYWNLLHQYYDTENYVAAKLTYKGFVYDSVGVQFKGQTSYRKAKQLGSTKFSFDVKTDHFIDGQEIDGYSTFNFNNAFEDHSFIREVFYTKCASKHIPAARSNFIHLYLNGQDWGLYPNIQQVNNDYIAEWFMDNDGIRWRADSNVEKDPDSPPGPNWGDGTAALNYHNNDSTVYQKYYTLKSSKLENPWDYLINACKVLEETNNPDYLVELEKSFNIDAILWFLATEILFSDDDSYVHKGKMDYCLYYDQNTGWLYPLEIDGNSVMKLQNDSWALFYHADDQNYPLLKNLLDIPDYRQRYLAHVRTILEESFGDESKLLIDSYKEKIRDLVKEDPKTLTTEFKFNNEINRLKSYIDSRRDFIESNPEMNVISPWIEDTHFSVNGVAWQAPKAGQTVLISSSANHPEGISEVNLYYAEEFNTPFIKKAMALNGDNYETDLIDLQAGNYVRFYIEAIANDAKSTRSYFPQGASHDVMVFKTETDRLENSYVVINEFMASNTSTVTDQDGEYDDWIELFNLSENSIDLSGFYLSDKSDNLTKWEIPQGTEIEAGAYLIVWADENGSEEGLHANFKLSKSGEAIYLTTPGLLIADEVEFGLQETDLSSARVPNGTGEFVIQEATFGYNNDDVNNLDQVLESEIIKIYPNPSDDYVVLALKNTSHTINKFSIFDALGSEIFTAEIQEKVRIDVSNWTPGLYYLKAGSHFTKMIVQ